MVAHHNIHPSTHPTFSRFHNSSFSVDATGEAECGYAVYSLQFLCNC